MAANPVDHFWGSANEVSSVPSVDPADLRSVWTMQNRFQALNPGQQIMISAGSYKQACGVEADVRAVFERVSHLSILQELGVLSPWLRDGVLGDAVFDVVATIPMNRMQIGVVYQKPPVDVEEFIKQVERRTQS